MQHVFIITHIDSFTGAQGGLQLILRDYLQRSVCLQGDEKQQVNIQAVKNQVLPLVMLADQIETDDTGIISVPGNALVSLVPLSSSAVQLMLDAGKADEMLQRIAGR